MITLIWIGLGSALGGVARYLVALEMESRLGHAIWGTLTVNVAGSFLIGLLAGLSEPTSKLMLPEPTRHFFMIGIMGGFTTFSTFSLQTVHLLRDGELTTAGANILLSVLVCVTGAWLGFAAASKLAS